MVEVPEQIHDEYDFHNIETPLFVESLNQRIKNPDEGITENEFKSILRDLQNADYEEVLEIEATIHGQKYKEAYPARQVFANQLLTLVQSSFRNFRLVLEDPFYKNEPHQIYMRDFLFNLKRKGGPGFLYPDKSPVYSTLDMGRWVKIISKFDKKGGLPDEHASLAVVADDTAGDENIPDEDYEFAEYNLRWEFDSLAERFVEAIAAKDYPKDNRNNTKELLWSLVDLYYNRYELEINDEAPHGERNYKLLRRR